MRKLRCASCGIRAWLSRRRSFARAWVRDKRRKIRWHVQQGLPLRIARAFSRSPGQRYCPICDRQSLCFLPSGREQRPDARCPYCFTAERHRLLWLFLVRQSHLFPPRPKVLHIGPGDIPYLVSKMKKHFGDAGCEYVTAGLEPRQVIVKADATTMPFANEVFDFIYCSHVLEHVEEDKKALREMRRVLRVGGLAICQVPITAEKTLEDPAVVDPERRFEVFGDPGHVRRYGPDFAVRLRASGFLVETFQVEDVVTEEAEATRLGLADRPQEILFLCRR